MQSPLTRLFLTFSQKAPTNRRKLISLAAGAIGFLALLPLLFIWFGGVVEAQIMEYTPGIIMWVCLPLGLAIIAWAVITQWRTGQGTPAPTAPTRTLVVSGPYRLCRNPIQLGAMIYYLGLGTWLSSIMVGMLAFLLALLLGSLYNRFIEEGELEARFGEDYRAYRRKTPFLIPRLWR